MHRFRSRAACALFAATIVAVLSAKVWANDSASPAEIAEARERFAEGRRLEEAGRFGEALVLFERVGRVKMTPQVRFHVALCLMHTGKLADALNAFRMAMREAGTTAPNVVAESKEHIASLEKRVAILTVVTPSDDASLTVMLDDRAILPGAAIVVDPGEHTIVLQHDGHTVDKRHVTLAAAERSTLDLSTAGTRPDARRTASFVAFGVTGAAVVGASVFAFLRAERLSTLEASCPTFTGCDRSLEPVVRDGNTYSVAVNVLAGVGLAATTTGIVLFASSIGSSPKRSAHVFDVRVSPALGVEGGFVWANGRF